MIGRCGSANERILVMHPFQFNEWFQWKTTWLEQV
jgi:hypothetical protein